MYIDGRRVVIDQRSKSQTINICSDANRKGHYERTFRLFRGSFVTKAEVAARTDLNDLQTWLRDRRAEDEGPRVPRNPGTGHSATPIGQPRPTSGPAAAPEPVVATTPAVVLGEPWLAAATRVVEVAIDSLVWEFVEHPYLHRVEHSLHARLFGLLAANPLFHHLLMIGNTGQYTQPVHKEWPETINRDGKNGRGNFDLAILNPEHVARATLEQFRQGRIAASIVIEVGLDYGLNHLSGDHEKLLNSRVESGFLIHFSRDKPRDVATEDYLLDIERAHRIAYAHHERSGVCAFKTLDGTTLQTRHNRE